MKRLLLFLAAAAAVLCAQTAYSVEYANLLCSPGVYVTLPGQATGDFFVDGAASSTGTYAVRIGTDASDDYAGGVLIPSVAQDLRDGVVYTPSVSVAADGSQMSITTLVSQTAVLGDVNVAAAYFPFSEGWLSGTTSRTDGATSGAMDTLVANGGLEMGVNWYDNGSGANQLWVDGIDFYSDGVLLAACNRGDQCYAMTVPNRDGSITICNHPNNRNSVNHYTAPNSFVFVPYGTEGIVAGRVAGSGGILGGTGYTVTPAQDGILRLSIDGYAPTDGTLIVTPGGGRGSSDDDIVTYEIVGDEFQIFKRDLDGTAENTPALSYTWGYQAFSFAFIPFDSQPTAPGSIKERVDYLGRVSAGNLAVQEFGSANTAASITTVAQSSPGVTVSDFNRGDNSIAIDGHMAHFADGVMFATTRQDYRDNTLTGGKTGVALSCPFPMSSGGPDSQGWQVSTMLADDATGGEMNVNFATSFFPFAQGWAMGVCENTNQGVGTLDAEAAGFDANADGLLFVNAAGNLDNYAAATPKADGSGWDVKVFGRDGLAYTTRTAQYNYLYLPYGDEGTKNVTMGEVDATGAVQASQGTTFTLTKEDGIMPGVYRLSIDGKTPDDGMLLLTATDGGTAGGNAFLVYEKDGDDFLIHGYQGVYFDEANPSNAEAYPMETGFNFAYVDFTTSPELGSAAVDPFAAPKVAAASWQITAQSGSNTGPIITRTGTSDSEFDLYEDESNRGDLRVKMGDGKLNAARGILMTQVCQNYRDNSAIDVDGAGLMGYAAYGMANPAFTGNGYEIATFSTDPAMGGANYEFDCDVAAVFFPYDGEFQVGAQPILEGVYQLRLDGSGDTNKSGVLITTAAGNDDNFSTAAPTADGLGWKIINRDNSAGAEPDDFSYVFLPFGTENLVAGRISRDGGRFAWCGDFHIEELYEDNGSSYDGAYRLTIKDVTPSDGVLLLTASTENYGSDNVLTYEADGDSFIIHGLDMQDTRAGILDETEFSFAFISYDNPPTNPALPEAFDPAPACAMNVKVVQYATDNARESTLGYAEYDPVTFERQATDRFAVNISNRGDTEISIDADKMTWSNGIVMGTPRCNGQDNGDGDGTTFGVVGMGGSLGTVGANCWMAIGRMGPTGAGGSEFNCDHAAAFFDFDGNWAGGYADASGTILIDGLGECTVTQTATGQYNLAIDGVDANTDGLLFTIAATNGDEIVSIDAAADGSWDLGMIDCQAGDLGVYRDGNFGFLYLPYGGFEGYQVEGLVGGEVAGDGSILSSTDTDGFTLVREAAGTYRLSIDGETPETGMLLLSVNDLEDNLLSYEMDGTDFLIMANDLGNGTAGLLEDVSFNFAFVGFDNPLLMVEAAMTLDGDANGDGVVNSGDLDIVRSNWGQTVPAGTSGDLNDDGTVNSGDLDLVRGNWGATLAASAVPEPGTLILLVTCLAAFAAARRRR